MVRAVARSLLWFPLMLFLAHFLGFAYAFLAAPVHAARGPYASITPSNKSAPLAAAYGEYLGDLLRLDLGPMPGSPDGLAETLTAALGASLGLLGLASALSIVLGLLFGMLAVRSDPPSVASWLTVTSTVGLAMPSFYVGSLFLMGLVFAVLSGLGRVPLPSQGFGWDTHLILPTLALIVRPSVQIAQVMAGLLAGELRQQYVVASRSLGFPWRIVRWKHALRNIATPVTHIVLRSFRLLIGELIVVEWLFAWPGIGRLLAMALMPGAFSGVGARDSAFFLHPALMASLVTLFAALLLIANALASLLAHHSDPRFRSGESEAARA